MKSEDTLINDVSDTALWVAYYRAKETERKQPLFRDPLAQSLIGDRGRAIAESMSATNRYTEWTVITRTVVIDEYIQKLIGEGVDTIVNLGAGLDTRPYRMNLPKTLRWIEADFQNIIEHKTKILKKEIPACALSRRIVDLSNDQARRGFLSEVGASAKKILVLTEGVTPYLTESQVATLATDLRAQPTIAYWVTEYFNPRVYPHLKAATRTNKMRNAPFQFFPADWAQFFSANGWRPKEIKYLGEEAVRQGRNMPMPVWARFFMIFAPRAAADQALRMSGFALLEPNYAPVDTVEK